MRMMHKAGEKLFVDYAGMTVAVAALDRLVHNAHRIKLSGESMRKTRATLTNLAANDE
jgi:DNA replication protein DnaC